MYNKAKFMGVKALLKNCRFESVPFMKTPFIFDFSSVLTLMYRNLSLTISLNV